MKFSSPLLQGTLIKRYNRFLATIVLESGETITAHCPNPGRLWGVTSPGLEVWVSRSLNPLRRLGYTWEIVYLEGTYIGVNTQTPNLLFQEAFQAKKLFPDYTSFKKEISYGDSRFDFFLQGSHDLDCYVEVKNVHMCRFPETAEFPDSVTKRGKKHLDTLVHAATHGYKAAMVYVIQRSDCTRLTFANDIDPAYAKAAVLAKENGVEFYAYSWDITPEETRLITRIPVVFP